MPDHIFFRIIQLILFRFWFVFFLNWLQHRMVSRVITATMLFLQFILYSSSFAGTLKIEIPGAALELCQLKLKQFSPDILKFSTKHEDNPFTSNYLWFLAYVCLYLMQACVDWVLIIFGTQVIKKKRPVPFLMTMLELTIVSDCRMFTFTY